LDAATSTLVNVESKEKEKNLLMWNVNVKSESEAKDLFKALVHEGLGVTEEFPFKVT
jgi:hypothetical protein